MVSKRVPRFGPDKAGLSMPGGRARRLPNGFEQRTRFRVLGLDLPEAFLLQAIRALLKLKTCFQNRKETL